MYDDEWDSRVGRFFSPKEGRKKIRFQTSLKARHDIYSFNFLSYVISLLNRKISIENPMHCGAFLPWFGCLNVGIYSPQNT